MPRVLSHLNPDHQDPGPSTQDIPLPLHLLVLGLGLADHADLALATDNLARVADATDTCLDLHG